MPDSQKSVGKQGAENTDRKGKLEIKAVIPYKNALAVCALLDCHEKSGEEHTKTEEPDSLPQEGAFGQSEAEDSIHAGSRTNSQEQRTIPGQWRQEDGKGKQAAKQGTDKAARDAAGRVGQARCATQEKVIDAEVEEQQDIQIYGLHVHHRLFFDYSTPPVQMLSKGQKQINSLTLPFSALQNDCPELH